MVNLHLVNTKVIAYRFCARVPLIIASPKLSLIDIVREYSCTPSHYVGFHVNSEYETDCSKISLAQVLTLRESHNTKLTRFGVVRFDWHVDGGQLVTEIEVVLLLSCL